MNQYRLDPRIERRLRLELLRAEVWANCRANAAVPAPPRSRRSGQAPSGLVASRFDRISRSLWQRIAISVAVFCIAYFGGQLVRGWLA